MNIGSMFFVVLTLILKLVSADEQLTIIKRKLYLEQNTPLFNISRMEAFKERSVAVNRRGERRTPSIAGAQFLPHGRLLLSDLILK